MRNLICLLIAFPMPNRVLSTHATPTHPSFHATWSNRRFTPWKVCQCVNACARSDSSTNCVHTERPRRACRDVDKVDNLRTPRRRSRAAPPAYHRDFLARVIGETASGAIDHDLTTRNAPAIRSGSRCLAPPRHPNDSGTYQTGSNSTKAREKTPFHV